MLHLPHTSERIGSILSAMMIYGDECRTMKRRILKSVSLQEVTRTCIGTVLGIGGVALLAKSSDVLLTRAVCQMVKYNIVANAVKGIAVFIKS